MEKTRRCFCSKSIQKIVPFTRNCHLIVFLPITEASYKILFINNVNVKWCYDMNLNGQQLFRFRQTCGQYKNNIGFVCSSYCFTNKSKYFSSDKFMDFTDSLWLFHIYIKIRYKSNFNTVEYQFILKAVCEAMCFLFSFWLSNTRKSSIESCNRKFICDMEKSVKEKL